MNDQQEKSFGTATMHIRFKERGREPRVYHANMLITDLNTSAQTWIASGSGTTSLGACSFHLEFDLKSRWYKFQFIFGHGLKLSFDTSIGIQATITENEIEIIWESEAPSVSPPYWSVQPKSVIQMIKD